MDKAKDDFESCGSSLSQDWGHGELAPGDYEFHFWGPAADAELIGSRIQGRWTFAQKQDAEWHPTPATKELIDLAEEFVARRKPRELHSKDALPSFKSVG